MATKHQYRPRRTGTPSIDEGFQVAFNHIYQLQTQIDGLSGTPAPTPAPAPPVIEIISGGGGGSVSVQITTLSVTLSGGGTVTVTPTAPTAANQVLYVILIEDATGGTLLAWGSTVSTNTPSAINTLAHAPTTFQFVSNGLIWQYVSIAA